MKSTFFFIAMLFFVNCTKDLIAPVKVDADSSLLEIAKETGSEAVFATMAIQLETQGGFHKVLSLLTSLVRDSKKQLHSITKIWRGVQTRCRVSKISLHARQDFFDTYLGQANRKFRNGSLRLAEIRDNLKAFRAARKTYKGILAAERSRHNFVRSQLVARIKHATKGLNSLKKAQAAVNDWTPKGRALIQTHLEDVSKSFVEVQQFELPSTTEFLERTTGANVKKRLLEWMHLVKGQLIHNQFILEKSLSKLNEIGALAEASIKSIRHKVKNHIASLRKVVGFARASIAHAKTSITLYADLSKQNKGVLAARRKYCRTEHNNYNDNAIRARNAIKMFRFFRTYFVNNYKKLHSYIKTKY